MRSFDADKHPCLTAGTPNWTFPTRKSPNYCRCDSMIQNILAFSKVFCASLNVLQLSFYIVNSLSRNDWRAHTTNIQANMSSSSSKLDKVTGCLQITARICMEVWQELPKRAGSWKCGEWHDERDKPVHRALFNRRLHSFKSEKSCSVGAHLFPIRRRSNNVQNLNAKVLSYSNYNSDRKQSWRHNLYHKCHTNRKQNTREKTWTPFKTFPTCHKSNTHVLIIILLSLQRFRLSSWWPQLKQWNISKNGVGQRARWETT